MSDTRARALAVARAAFADRGFDATSLDEVARSVGVRKQTILYYFPSKDALLIAAIDATAAELSAALERALSRAPDGWDFVDRASPPVCCSASSSTRCSRLLPIWAGGCDSLARGTLAQAAPSSCCTSSSANPPR